jgi:hypothetical protein
LDLAGRKEQEDGENCILSLIIFTVRQILIKGMGELTRMGDMKNVYKILDRKHVGKRPHGRLSCRWEDNIKRDLKNRV